MRIFCEGRPGSSEHIFPGWLNRVFHQLDWTLGDEESPEWARSTTSNFVSGERSENVWNANQIASITLNKLCHGCNTGWMAGLESRAAPLLTPMILGRRRRPLDLAQQLIVATWATKTAMVCEASLGPQDRNFPLADRKILMDGDRCPGHVRVFAAAIEGEIMPARFSVVRGTEVQR